MIFLLTGIVLGVSGLGLVISENPSSSPAQPKPQTDDMAVNTLPASPAQAEPDNASQASMRGRQDESKDHTWKSRSVF
jgi:hypothetical protein